MPLLPLPVLRVLEGLLAVACLCGAFYGILFVGVAAVAWAAESGPVEIFGIRFTALMAAGVSVAFVLLAVWFGFNAIRGGSTPTEGSERDGARKG